jgi:hypothetical protein
VYPIVALALGIFLFGVMGGISFGPKYMENQFNIPTWQANIILGKINYCIFSITGKTFNSLDCE